MIHYGDLFFNGDAYFLDILFYFEETLVDRVNPVEFVLVFAENAVST